MGNEQSSGEAYGFRVLSVLPGSPGTAAKLESYFDFIVEAAGIRLDNNDQTFQDVIKNHLGKQLPLKVYNCMSETTRDVILCPRLNWGGSGALGITIRFDSFENAMSEAIHILSVEDGSPAALAGLSAQSDYLLGTSDAAFHDEIELAEVFARNIENPLEVFVYSAETEMVRRATVTPSYAWGGDGLLGCDIGSGLLHQIPSVSSSRLASIVGAGAWASTIASRRVRSPLGKGWIKDARGDGVFIVELDWKLANNSRATLITQEQHLRFIMDETPLPEILPEAVSMGVDIPKSATDMGPAPADELQEPGSDEPTSHQKPGDESAAKDGANNYTIGGAQSGASAPKMEVDLS